MSFGEPPCLPPQYVMSILVMLTENLSHGPSHKVLALCKVECDKFNLLSDCSA